MSQRTCAQRFVLVSTLLLGSILGPGTAVGAADVAYLRMDLESGISRIEIGERILESHFDPDSLKVQLALLHRALAHGQSTSKLQEKLGHELMAEAGPLREVQVWQIDVVPFPDALAYFGLLGALRAPWQRSDALLSHDHVLVYRWPEPVRARSATPEQDELLVVAPFTPGLEPLSDDPDTLLWSLRPQLRSVQLIPRNDSSVSTVRRNLDRGDVLMLWMRALPEWATPILDEVEDLPPFVVWSLPSNGPVPRLSEIVSALPRAQPTAPTIIVQLWPQPESTIARCARSFVRHLQDGRSVGSAWAEAAGRDLPAANDRAGWVILGAGSAQASLARAPRLRRFLDALH
jgi:hypothetical protein